MEGRVVPGIDFEDEAGEVDHAAGFDAVGQEAAFCYYVLAGRG